MLSSRGCCRAASSGGTGASCWSWRTVCGMTAHCRVRAGAYIHAVRCMHHRACRIVGAFSTRGWVWRLGPRFRFVASFIGAAAALAVTLAGIGCLDYWLSEGAVALPSECAGVNCGSRPWFRLVSARPGPFTGGHPDRVRAVHGRRRTSVNAGQHCWKAYC